MRSGSRANDSGRTLSATSRFSLVARLSTSFLFHVAAIVGLANGAVGVFGLVVGCTLMVHETRVAVQTLAEGGGGWPGRNSAMHRYPLLLSALCNQTLS